MNDVKTVTGATIEQGMARYFAEVFRHLMHLEDHPSPVPCDCLVYFAEMRPKGAVAWHGDKG